MRPPTRRTARRGSNAELQEEGASVGLNRVSRLMRRGGLVGVTRRRQVADDEARQGCPAGAGSGEA